MAECFVCREAIESGRVRCHCPPERDGTPAKRHDHKWLGAGGTHLTCPVRLFQDNHLHDNVPISELADYLGLITKQIGGDYDVEKTLAVRRGLIEEEGD